VSRHADALNDQNYGPIDGRASSASTNGAGAAGGKRAGDEQLRDNANRLTRQTPYRMSRRLNPAGPAHRPQLRPGAEPSERSAGTRSSSAGGIRSKPRSRSNARAGPLPVVVSARTAVAPDAPASSNAAAIAARPIPLPRILRVSQMPVSRMPGCSVRFRRTEPTTRPPATTAQVASPAGPTRPGRRSRWNPRSHLTLTGVHASPGVSVGVTSSADASEVAASTS
jgi:hypothetical protein